MDSLFLDMVTDLIIGESNTLSVKFMLAVIIFGGVYVTKTILIPMQKKMIENNALNDINLKELTNKLDEVSKILTDHQQNSKLNKKDIERLDKNVEDVKQILSQFQGYLTYGNVPSPFKKEVK